MDENDSLSKCNKIPLGHIVPMAPFTPKSTSKLRSALPIRYSIAGLGSSTVDQVLKYIKYPKYVPITSTGQVLIFIKST